MSKVLNIVAALTFALTIRLLRGRPVLQRLQKEPDQARLEHIEMVQGMLIGALLDRGQPLD